MSIEILPLTDPSLLMEINNDGVPGVTPVDAAKAAWLLSIADTALVAEVDGRPAGVLLLMAEDGAHHSIYIDWFRKRWLNFIYLDRVSVASWARGQGVASALYREVDRLADLRRAAIATEVYCDPPNHASLGLHARMGYVEVGKQHDPAEGKTVVKLVKFMDRAILRWGSVGGKGGLDADKR
jgi:predicted GNAT superfamily acetyltransferase